MKDCLDNQVQSALQIPYFEGDFWSNIIEESIKGKPSIESSVVVSDHSFLRQIELDQEEEERRKKEEVEAARAMEDTGFDDPIEPEDPTEVKLFFSLVVRHAFRRLRLRSDLGQTEIGQYSQEEKSEENSDTTKSSEETNVQLYRSYFESFLDDGETQRGTIIALICFSSLNDSIKSFSGILCYSSTKSDDRLCTSE